MRLLPQLFFFLSAPLALAFYGFLVFVLWKPYGLLSRMADTVTRIEQSLDAGRSLRQL